MSYVNNIRFAQTVLCFGTIETFNYLRNWMDTATNVQYVLTDNTIDQHFLHLSSAFLWIRVLH